MTLGSLVVAGPAAMSETPAGGYSVLTVFDIAVSDFPPCVKAPPDESVKVPLWLSLTVKRTEPPAPAGTSPSAHETSPPDALPPLDADTKLMPAGSRFDSVSAVAPVAASLTNEMV